MIADLSRHALFMRQRITLFAAMTLLLAGCSSSPGKPATHESLNATLWSQTAAEYVAVSTQAYRVAAANLELALADSNWSAALEQQGDYSSLPPAVLMDIDETVLDNSRYNARIVMQHGEYSQKTFTEWCEESAAPAIPGAKYFVDQATERGVTVIYYSRRIEILRDCTTRNLQALGFPLPDQQYLLLNDKQPGTSKAHLRSELSSRFRILLLIGDDLEDFVAGTKADPAVRQALAHQYADRWGKEWIVLPNSMYGTWETSLYDLDYALPRAEKLELKSRHLAD
jgi:acid phosphatase